MDFISEQVNLRVMRGILLVPSRDSSQAENQTYFFSNLLVELNKPICHFINHDPNLDHHFIKVLTTVSLRHAPLRKRANIAKQSIGDEKA